MREQIERAERIARTLASREFTVDQVLAGSGEAEREILHAMAEHLPNTTLTVRELAELLNERGAGPAHEDLLMSRLSSVVGGETPLCEVLKQLDKRFPHLLLRRQRTPILVILSDGLATDGDPRPIVERMRKAGVVVFGCYVTGSDLFEPRTLVSQPGQNWDEGARLLFDCASGVDDGPRESDYLRSQGWTVEPQARFFSQVNHSTYVSDLLAAALG